MKPFTLEGGFHCEWGAKGPEEIEYRILRRMLCKVPDLALQRLEDRIVAILTSGIGWFSSGLVLQHTTYVTVLGPVRNCDEVAGISQVMLAAVHSPGPDTYYAR